MLWSALQILLPVYLGLVALIYFKQSSLVFLPEMDRGFRASPADIGLTFTPLSLATTDGETLDGWFVPADTKGATHSLVIFFTAMRETWAIGWIICACSTISDCRP